MCGAMHSKLDCKAMQNRERGALGTSKIRVSLFLVIFPFFSFLVVKEEAFVVVLVLIFLRLKFFVSYFLKIEG